MNEYKVFYPDYKSIKFQKLEKFTQSSAYSNHLEHLKNDPDFIKSINDLDNGDGNNYHKQVQDIIFRFLVSRVDVGLADDHTPFAILLTQDQPRLFKMIDDPDDDSRIGISLPENITKTEYVNLWDVIKNFQHLRSDLKPTKHKGPENSELLYEVFIQRRARETFKRIYEMYSSGRLGNYDGGNYRFKTSKDLEDYYRLYYPSI